MCAVCWCAISFFTDFKLIGWIEGICSAVFAGMAAIGGLTPEVRATIAAIFVGSYGFVLLPIAALVFLILFFVV